MVDILATGDEPAHSTYEGTEDFIPFKFEVINHTDPTTSNRIHFRAFLDSLSDNYNASFNEVKYSGRPEPFYSYNAFGRKISLAFKIAAQTRHEMKPLYRRLNYLVSQTAPGFVGDRMATPFMKLTVGDWIKGVPGVLNSVNLTWQTDYSWEIKSDPKDIDQDVLILPHVLDVGIDFTPTHNFIPSNAKGASSFIGSEGDFTVSTVVPSAED